MKIAITGETAHARAELVGRAVAAGLNMMTSVSRHTSVLVTNEPASRSAKARRAAAEGVPVIDEHTFLRLLADVQAGTVHEATAASAAIAPVKEPATAAAQAAQPKSTTAPVPEMPVLPPPSPDTTVPAPRQPGDSAGTLAKPLMSRRVLVLGGAHTEAVAARTRVVELGGSAAVNLSASVTDVVLLADGEKDRRMSRITVLGLPVHDADWLISPTADAPAAAAVRPKEPHVMPRGGVIDLPIPYGGPSPEWYVTASWAPQADCEIDVVAFILDDDEQVTFDEDFIFYGAPESPAGTVRLLPAVPPNRPSPSISHPCRPLPERSSSPQPSTAQPPSGRSARSRSVRLPATTDHPSPGPPWTPRQPNAPCSSQRSTAGARRGACVPSGRATTTASTPLHADTGSTSPTERQCRRSVRPLDQERRRAWARNQAQEPAGPGTAQRAVAGGIRCAAGARRPTALPGVHNSPKRL